MNSEEYNKLYSELYNKLYTDLYNKLKDESIITKTYNSIKSLFNFKFSDFFISHRFDDLKNCQMKTVETDETDKVEETVETVETVETDKLEDNVEEIDDSFKLESSIIDKLNYHINREVSSDSENSTDSDLIKVLNTIGSDTFNEIIKEKNN